MDSVDPDDRERFGAANHHHLTIQQDPAGWRLWCLNCDLKGNRLYPEREIALRAASALRGIAKTPCAHHIRALGIGDYP